MKIWRKTIINIFILLGSWLFFQAKAEEELVCDTSGACDNKVVGTMIQDPIDCHKYYICVTNAEGDVIVSDTAIVCPTGFYFSDEEQSCITEDYKCRNKCDNLFCPKSCENVASGDRIAYPNDCSKFIVCVQDSEPIVGECSPEVPYFNGTSCSTEAYSCCDICTPYCEAAFTEVEDPYDCSSFYLCQSVDYIPEEEQFSCESGQYFDASVGYCVDSNGTICYPVCNWYTTTVLTTRVTTWLPTTQTKSVSTVRPFTTALTTEEEQVSSEASDLPSTDEYTTFTELFTGPTATSFTRFVQKKSRKSVSFRSVLNLLTGH